MNWDNPIVGELAADQDLAVFRILPAKVSLNITRSLKISECACPTYFTGEAVWPVSR